MWWFDHFEASFIQRKAGYVEEAGGVATVAVLLSTSINKIMSKRPLRVTGFTRFFIVMLFIAPLAYVGASYYNGEDGIAKIKHLLNIGETSVSIKKEQPSSDSETERSTKTSTSKTLDAEIEKLKEELEFERKTNEELYKENKQLKLKLESTEKALEESKGK